MTTTTAPAISVAGLQKRHGDTVVLDGIDLEVPTGTVLALLGPNGAGKTTTVQVLTTLLPADGGTAVVAGCDVRTDPDGVRAAIGVTGQFSAVDKLLTGRENLRLMADLHHLGRAEGRRRADALLEQFDLASAAGKPASTFSGGMVRKLDLAMTLMGRPRVIFLDEPTTGLDPRSRREVWRAVRELVADGGTVFLTTQHLEEADHLADRIAVLDGGRLVAQGTAPELKRLVPGGHVELRFADLAALSVAERVFDGSTADPEQLILQVGDDGGVAALRDVLDRLDAASVPVEALTLHTPDLDDVFLALTGAARPGPAAATPARGATR